LGLGIGGRVRVRADAADPGDARAAAASAASAPAASVAGLESAELAPFGPSCAPPPPSFSPDDSLEPKAPA
jgi:hypothetical protein